MHVAVAERDGENKITRYIPLIPAPSTLLRAGFSIEGEGAATCVDTYGQRDTKLFIKIAMQVIMKSISL